MMLTIKMPTSLIKFYVKSRLSWRHSDNGRLARLRLLREMLDTHTEETVSVDEELFKFLDL